MAAIHRSLDAGSDARQLARQVVESYEGCCCTRWDRRIWSMRRPRCGPRWPVWRLGAPLTTLLRDCVHSVGRRSTHGRVAAVLGLELALMDTIQARAVSTAPAGRAAAVAGARRRSSSRGRKPGADGPPAAPKKAGARPSESAVTAKAVAENWEAIFEAAYRLDTRTQALLRSGKLLGMPRWSSRHRISDRDPAGEDGEGPQSDSRAAGDAAGARASVDVRCVC